MQSFFLKTKTERKMIKIYFKKINRNQTDTKRLTFQEDK